MISEEAFIGRRVLVSTSYRKPEMRGQAGTILKRWGDPHYLALDVLLEDGTSRLFWHHELDECEEDDRATGRHPWNREGSAAFTEAEGERVTES